MPKDKKQINTRTHIIPDQFVEVWDANKVIVTREGVEVLSFVALVALGRIEFGSAW